MLILFYPDILTFLSFVSITKRIISFLVAAQKLIDKFMLQTPDAPNTYFKPVMVFLISKMTQ